MFDLQVVIASTRQGRKGASVVFSPEETHDKAATTMLNELVRWTEALSTLRQPRSQAGA
jgi:hypothetical protein